MNKADLIDKIAKDAKISKTASGKALGLRLVKTTMPSLCFGTSTVCVRKPGSEPPCESTRSEMRGWWRAAAVGTASAARTAITANFLFPRDSTAARV